VSGDELTALNAVLTHSNMTSIAAPGAALPVPVCNSLAPAKK
jgi:hypothetical protein